MLLSSRDNQGKFLPKNPTSPHNQPSLFFSDFELEYPLGEHLEIFEKPIGEEEEHTSLVQAVWSI